MKKVNLLKGLIAISIISFQSCSKDEANPTVIDNSVIVDYIVETGFANTLSINSDNATYLLTQPNDLKKVSESGNLTTPSNNNIVFSNFSSIANTSTADLYYSNNSNKINKLNSSLNSITSYTMPDIPLLGTPIIREIGNAGHDTFMFFEFKTLSLRKYIPISNSSVFVAGNSSGNIVDGIGVNASFKYVNKIIANNNIIYIIDDSKNIRKIELIAGEYKVTTLISNYSFEINDIAFDSQNNMYALIADKGIYKLNNNQLVVFKDGSYKWKPSNGNISSFASDTFSFRKMLIKNEDMYLSRENNLIKISNFKTKL